ncbi:hypothetical protein Bca52824_028455 [Brassica carinata]|uniref:Uncharacterized protein n=1 Tax=Brassica carinata TaxID=52824 RepID=A0A8X8AQ52_BRACI|nr:hypothetical protein Bca52824_028455 [Brassica carinata]
MSKNDSPAMNKKDSTVKKRGATTKKKKYTVKKKKRDTAKKSEVMTKKRKLDGVVHVVLVKSNQAGLEPRERNRISIW